MYSFKLVSKVSKLFICMIVSVFVFNQGELFLFRNLSQSLTPVPKTAEANYQFSPTGGAIVTGTNPAILGATAAATEGVNMGDWRGSLANDDLHFGITSTASGYNAYLDLAGFQLNNANAIIIQTEFDLDATAPNTLVQICDWVSSTGVNNAADAQCTTGGWRNLNLNDVAINTVTPTSYSWQIHNSYWNSDATTAINTPLTNFVNSGSVRIRFFSTTNTTSVVHIDYLRAFAVVQPIYSASGAVQISGGTVLGDYSQTNIGGTGQTGADDARFRVPGTAGSISDFYLSFDDVRTYTGANTILVRAEYSCNTTGINHRPKIYNFTTASWEDLTTASIACSTSDVNNAWAKNNIIISDYVNNGEVRVGWYGLANGTQEIRLDFAYITIGTTNTDGVGEISFGSVSAGTVDNTRTLDMTGTASTWNILSADESNTQAFATYALDGDNDAVVEEASAANINFDVTVPPNTLPTGIFFASRHMSGVAGTVQVGVRDYSGLTSITGGWSTVGANSTTLLTYTDAITSNTVASGGHAGFNTNPEDYIDSVNNKMNIRLRTNTSGPTTNNSVAQWDFAMVSLQWVEDANHPTETYQFAPTGGAIVTGTNPAILGATTPTVEGVNTGDWRGALANDDLHFGIQSTASGYNAYLDFAGVQLNGANTIIIQTELDLDATAPNTLVQICDWVSSTGVNNAADAQCTTGGWRNLNLNDAVINVTTSNTYGWHIYNGYWDSTATTPIDTPLTNFLNNGSMRIRFFSTTNTTSVVHIDYVRTHAVVHPIYSASGVTQISGAAPLGNYSLTSIGVNQTGADDARFRVPGTAGSISDFYLSFDDVRTYTGANTILVRAEYSCSATGINHRPKIYNFTTASWEDLTTASIACSATDATNAWAKNNVTISDYVNNGEVRVGWYGLANGTQEIRLDFVYIMIGTTNTDGLSEITYGSNSAGSVTNTNTLDMTGTASTWNILSADESNTQAFATYARDSDNDATVEEASAANINFDVTLPTNTAATAILSASRHMAGTGGTVQPAIKDYSGYTNVTGGWSLVGAGGGTTLNYTDNVTTNVIGPTGLAGWNTNPEDHIDTVNNKINLALRTIAGGTATNNAIAQWDFAMVSVQWIEVPKINTLSFSISDNTVGFGTVTPSATRYATGDTLGSISDSANAHTISARTNADSGYTIRIDGTTLTCSSCGGATITAVGEPAASSSVGTEQFGFRGTIVNGTGNISAPYNTADWAFATSSLPDEFATGAGDNVTTVFGIRYMANTGALTEAGVYSGAITYVITASY